MTSHGKTTKSASPRRPRADPGAVSPRVARRERRRERSRAEIVEACRRVLLHEGVAGVTLEAVAKEVGLTKAALYYYYPSKDALLFDIGFDTLEAQAQAVHAAVENAKDGAEALRAIIRETVRTYAARFDDFRITFMHSQVATPGSFRVDPQNLERIRPLNDLTYAGATKKLTDDWKHGRGRVRINPRLMAFLANVAAVGMLTVKGMVEASDDPLLYSDEELVEGLARIFEAAARP